MIGGEGFRAGLAVSVSGLGTRSSGGHGWFRAGALFVSVSGLGTCPAVIRGGEFRATALFVSVSGSGRAHSWSGVGSSLPRLCLCRSALPDAPIHDQWRLPYLGFDRVGQRIRHAHSMIGGVDLHHGEPEQNAAIGDCPLARPARPSRNQLRRKLHRLGRRQHLPPVTAEGNTAGRIRHRNHPFKVA